MKKLSELALKGTIHAQLAVQDFVSKHPREMIIANRMVAFTALMLVADQAMAAGLGVWAQKFKTDTLKPLLEFGMYGAYAGGMGCTGIGVNKFIKLSKGDQQTTFGEGTGWTFGGGALMGLGAIANGVGESMSAGGCAAGTYCGN